MSEAEIEGREHKTKRRRTNRRPPPPDALAYRIPDAAERIGISPSTLWAMIAKGQIEARKIGGSTVIRRVALEAYIEGIPARDTGR